jgi:hypothetical protein
MEARKLARWAVRAAVIGGLAFGAIYGAANVSASDSTPPPPPSPIVTESPAPSGEISGGSGQTLMPDGVIWG